VVAAFATRIIGKALKSGTDDISDPGSFLQEVPLIPMIVSAGSASSCQEV
jgi:hypothetical protein